MEYGLLDHFTPTRPTSDHDLAQYRSSFIFIYLFIFIHLIFNFFLILFSSVWVIYMVQLTKSKLFPNYLNINYTEMINIHKYKLLISQIFLLD